VFVLVKIELQSDPFMTLIGSVKDIQPNAAKPTLELSFPRSDGGHLTRGGKVPITLIIHGVSWRGTMCNEGKRDVYVHTRLHDDNGRTATCTEVLTSLNLAHDGRLQFEVITPDTLRLERVLQRGAWPPGSAPAERGKNPPAATHSPSRQVPGGQESSSAALQSSFPFGDCAEIRRLATVYWDLITRIEAEEERRFPEEFAEARKQGFLSKELFLRVARWKSVRQTPNYESNSEESVRAATRAAFAAPDDRTALAALMRLRGMALRTASAILQWMRPDTFVILDVHVVAALGWHKPTSWEDLEFYSRVAERVHGLARACEVDLRTIDRALWAWDKLRSLGRA
jgi:hypothetical protein